MHCNEELCILHHRASPALLLRRARRLACFVNLLCADGGGIMDAIVTWAGALCQTMLNNDRGPTVVLLL